MDSCQKWRDLRWLSERLAKGFEPSHVSYHADGSYYQSDYDGKAYPLGKKKPLNEIRGYEHLLIYEGPTELIRSGYFIDFSLQREDEGVYVDMRRLGKLWRFGVGMLEPFAFEGLQVFLNQTFLSIHLITSSKPWLIVGYGPSYRPITKIERLKQDQENNLGHQPKSNSFDEKPNQPQR
jgi:hypothetical protein